MFRCGSRPKAIRTFAGVLFATCLLVSAAKIASVNADPIPPLWTPLARVDSSGQSAAIQSSANGRQGSARASLETIAPSAGDDRLGAPSNALQLDDGSAEAVVGVVRTGTKTGFQSVTLNRFTPGPATLPLTVDTVSILFPIHDPMGNNTGLSAGKTFQVLVYSDPSGSGDPANATLRLRQNFRLAPSNTRFQEIALSPPVTIVAGDVWIGYTNTVTAGDHQPLYHAALDQGASQRRSWTFFDGDGADFDGADLSSAPIKSLIDDLGFPGNWLIRASGRKTPVVAGITPDWAPATAPGFKPPSPADPGEPGCEELSVKLTGVGFDNVAAVFFATEPDGTGTRIDLTNVRTASSDTVFATVPLVELQAQLNQETPFYVFVESADGTRSVGYRPGEHPLDLTVTFARYSDSCTFWSFDEDDPNAVPVVGEVISPCKQTNAKAETPSATAKGQTASVIAFKIFTSDNPGVELVRNNLQKTVPPNLNLSGFPRLLTGSGKSMYYKVVACRDDGTESVSMEGDLQPPILNLGKPPRVRASKIVAFGSRFNNTKVLVDGIPFTSDPEFPGNGRKLVQRGTLANGQTIGEYLTPGRAATIKFQNEDGSAVYVPVNP